MFLKSNQDLQARSHEDTPYFKRRICFTNKEEEAPQMISLYETTGPTAQKLRGSSSEAATDLRVSLNHHGQPIADFVKKSEQERGMQYKEERKRKIAITYANTQAYYTPYMFAPKPQSAPQGKREIQLSQEFGSDSFDSPDFNSDNDEPTKPEVPASDKTAADANIDSELRNIVITDHDWFANLSQC